WWPWIEPDEVARSQGRRPVEALVMNASGCGATVKDYGRLLADDPAYAARAARVSALTRDLSELLPELLPQLQQRLGGAPRPLPRLALHPPCTLQHGQKLRSASSRSACRPKAICAAARPAPTRCCSRSSHASCATASSAICRRCRPT
ncbi:MAG: hypothetical protein RJA44_2442, partial [Pseudomonadota bacterium]